MKKVEDLFQGNYRTNLQGEKTLDYYLNTYGSNKEFSVYFLDEEKLEIVSGLGRIFALENEDFQSQIKTSEGWKESWFSDEQEEVVIILIALLKSKLSKFEKLDNEVRNLVNKLDGLIFHYGPDILSKKLEFPDLPKDRTLRDPGLFELKTRS